PQGRRGREGIRFLPQRAIFRTDRQGFDQAAQGPDGSARKPGRSAPWDGCQSPASARRDSGIGLNEPMATIETSSMDESGAVPRPQTLAHARPWGLHFAGALSIIAGLALWEFLSRVVVANALFLAAPTQIFAAIYNLAISGQLWPH